MNQSITKKMDLHCHLDGSLPITSVRRMAGRCGIALPEDDAALRTLMEVPEGCTSLEEYLERFALPIALMQTAENLYDAARDVLLNAAEEGVIYMEMRFAPLQHMEQGLRVTDILEAVIAGAQEAVDLTAKTPGAEPIQFGIIVCGMRNHDVKNNVAMLEEVMPFYGKGVCALDIAGAETPFPPRTQQAFFEEAQKLGIPYTIHAGETGSWQYVLDAIDLGASRIGHGIAIADHPEALQLCVERQIPLEICPLSNFQTRAIGKPEDYPLRRLIDAGVLVTINTDNRTVSNTSITREMALARKIANLTPEEEVQLFENAKKAAFNYREAG